MNNTHSDINNDIPSHRAEVIDALREEGITGFQYHSGGGCFHVAVVLVQGNPGDDELLIATGSIESPCDVSLFGYRDGNQVQGDVWVSARSISEVVSAFRRFWDDRSAWVEKFRAGTLDM